jgi:hypothetical protein
MVEPAKLRAALEALRNTVHRYVGLRPVDVTFKESPAFVLAEKNVQALMYAMNSAEGYWPNCGEWELIGSDDLLSQVDDDWPPSYRSFRDPVAVVSF